LQKYREGQPWLWYRRFIAVDECKTSNLCAEG
jgi:hypothetical protein